MRPSLRLDSAHRFRVQSGCWTASVSLEQKLCRNQRCILVLAFAGTAVPVAPDCVLACEMMAIGQTVTSATVELISGADTVALAAPSDSHHGTCTGPALVAQESKRTERERNASNAVRLCISPRASRRRQCVDCM